MAETIPDVVAPTSPSDYLEVMTRAVFQTGVSWKQIAEHWDAYRAAFGGFDPERVAAYSNFDVERILETPDVLRSPRKVRATIANAGALLGIRDEFQSIPNYLRSFPTYEKLAKDLKRRFAFMGPMNAWYFLFRTGEPVPRFEQWVTTIEGEHPRMRQMVEHARAAGRSKETC